MDYNVSMLLEKIKVVAEQTRTGAVKAADRAGRKANEMAQATRLNLQIFESVPLDVLWHFECCSFH